MPASQRDRIERAIQVNAPTDTHAHSIITNKLWLI